MSNNKIIDKIDEIPEPSFFKDDDEGGHSKNIEGSLSLAGSNSTTRSVPKLNIKKSNLFQKALSAFQTARSFRSKDQNVQIKLFYLKYIFFSEIEILELRKFLFKFLRFEHI